MILLPDSFYAGFLPSNRQYYTSDWQSWLLFPTRVFPLEAKAKKRIFFFMALYNTTRLLAGPFPVGGTSRRHRVWLPFRLCFAQKNSLNLLEVSSFGSISPSFVAFLGA